MSDNLTIPGLVFLHDLYFDPLEVRAVRFVPKKKSGGLGRDEDFHDRVEIYYGDPVVMVGHHDEPPMDIGDSGRTVLKSQVAHPHFSIPDVSKDEYIQFLTALGQAKLEARGVSLRASA